MWHINTKSFSIVEVTFCCYCCCDMETSDGNGGGENSSSSLSEVFSYENTWFSSSKRIVAKLD